jgi:plastocyanin domain-containing protein
MKKGKKGWIAVVVVVILVGFLIYLLIPKNPSQPDDNGTVISDGVQIVKLSFGQYNYDPEMIRVRADVPVKIVADMSRLKGCFTSFQIPSLGLRKVFTSSNNILEFTPKAGTYAFSCIMGMGRGTIIVQ